MQVSLLNVDSTTTTGVTPSSPIALTAVSLSGAAIVHGLLTVWVPDAKPLGRYNICDPWIIHASRIIIHSG